jgi:hypothetical protein
MIHGFNRHGLEFGHVRGTSALGRDNDVQLLR